MSIVETLRKIAKEVYSEIPRINYGGCCVYAGRLGERLQDRGFNVWGRVSNWVGSVDTARVKASQSNQSLRNVSDWNENGLGFFHVFLQLKDESGKVYTHDAEHTVRGYPGDFGGCGVVKGRLTVKEMLILGADADGWNSYFPRHKIPFIQNVIDKYLPR